MWKCQIFLRLGGKNAVARVAVQAAVYSLSYCYGAFYTIVLFRQLVNAIQARASFESVLGLLAVFCAMGVANTLLKGWYEHRFVPRSDCALEQALAASVYQKAASADLACFEDSDYYDRMGRAAATARESALAALDAMSDLLATACILVANALYVVWVDGTLLPLIALPAALALHWQRKKGALEGRMEEVCEPYRRRTAYARRVLLLKEYAQEIRLTGAGKIAAARFREGCAGLMRVARERGWRIALYEIGAEFLLRVVLYAGLYGYAAWRYLACAAFTLGDFAAISGAINNVVWFVEKSGEHIATLRKQAHAAGQLDAFMREEIRVRGGSEPCAFQNEIALKDIRFSYPGAKRAALTGVSLTLRRGESIALVGENGAGKTTLVKLLLRLYDPEAGEILLDGRPYRAYQLDSLRAQFAVAFQDSRLYPFSVSENVRVGRVESEEAVREALNRAGLAGLAPSRAVTREFDADGWNPSGGQAQRLFAARVFASGAPIAILDEPSAMLDPLAEEALFAALREGSRGRTAIFISHRLTSVKWVDRVVMMQNGAIVEQGTHEELLARGGAYARLFFAQAERYRKEGAPHET